MEEITKQETFYDAAIASVDHKWILAKMDELSIGRETIMDWLGLDKPSLSLMLSGKRNLTKMAKCAIYYFFKYRKVHLEFVRRNLIEAYENEKED